MGAGSLSGYGPDEPTLLSKTTSKQAGSDDRGDGREEDDQSLTPEQAVAFEAIEREIADTEACLADNDELIGAAVLSGL